MTLADAVLKARWAAAAPPTDAPAHRVDLAPGIAGPLVGIDIGGTKVHAAAWTRAGLTELTAPTDPAGGLAAIDQVASVVTQLTGGQPPAAVAIGAPGIPQHDGTLAHAPNVPGWDRIDIPAALGRRVGAPVRMENDVALAAWGEHLWGGERDLSFVAVGTGIGVGIVQGGGLLRGSEGGAGEVFDLPLVTPSAAPGAHILEDVASGPGLEREYAARSGDAVATHEILARLREDPAAGAAVEAVAAGIAHLVASIRCLLDPALVVLGGGLGSRTELADEVRRRLDGLALRPVDVRVSRLGPRAATVGALGLAHALSGCPREAPARRWQKWSELSRGLFSGS